MAIVFSQNEVLMALLQLVKHDRFPRDRRLEAIRALTLRAQMKNLDTRALRARGEAIKRLGKPVIGKKILAAGHLQLEEAFTYIGQMGCVDIAALGIASEKEAEETFAAAVSAFSGISYV